MVSGRSRERPIPSGKSRVADNDEAITEAENVKLVQYETSKELRKRNFRDSSAF